MGRHRTGSVKVNTEQTPKNGLAYMVDRPGGKSIAPLEIIKGRDSRGLHRHRGIAVHRVFARALLKHPEVDTPATRPGRHRADLRPFTGLTPKQIDDRLWDEDGKPWRIVTHTDGKRYIHMKFANFTFEKPDNPSTYAYIAAPPTNQPNFPALIKENP